MWDICKESSNFPEFWKNTGNDLGSLKNECLDKLNDGYG